MNALIKKPKIKKPKSSIDRSIDQFITTTSRIIDLTLHMIRNNEFDEKLIETTLYDCECLNRALIDLKERYIIDRNTYSEAQKYIEKIKNEIRNSLSTYDLKPIKDTIPYSFSLFKSGIEIMEYGKIKRNTLKKYLREEIPKWKNIVYTNLQSKYHY